VSEATYFTIRHVYRIYLLLFSNFFRNRFEIDVSYLISMTKLVLLGHRDKVEWGVPIYQANWPILAESILLRPPALGRLLPFVVGSNLPKGDRNQVTSPAKKR
jgi:hypothetical protein